MWLLIIISIIVLFLTGLMVLPIRLVLNSEKRKYFIDIPIYFRAQLVPDNQLFFFKLRLFFVPIKINPFKMGKAKKKTTKQKSGKRRMKMKSNAVIKFFEAFTIKKANADIDTGDFPLNAQLIPVTQLLNNRNVHLQINFEKRNTIDLEIFTRLYKLMWIGIQNKSKS